MKNGRQIMPNLTNEKLCYGLFWHVFCGFSYFLSIFLNFWPKYYTWLESSGNEDSDATFPKSLEGTSKRTDFCNSGVREV